MATAVENEEIQIQCTCGRRGTVAGRFAGRKVRCTACGEAVRVGSGRQPAARTQARSPAAALASAPTTEPAADCGLELLPAVERQAAEWESRARPVRRDTDRRRLHAPAQRGRRRAHGGDESRRDLDTEAHLRALAFWQLLGGALGVFGALLFALTGLGQAPAGAVLMMAAFMCGASMVSGALGYFLWTYHGAARVVYMVFSAIAVLSNMVQFVTVPGVGKLVVLCAAAWSTAIFMVVASARAAYVCTPEYRALVLRTRARVRWWGSPFFWLPIVLVVLTIGATVLLVAAAVGSAF